MIGIAMVVVGIVLVYSGIGILMTLLVEYIDYKYFEEKWEMTENEFLMIVWLWPAAIIVIYCCFLWEIYKKAEREAFKIYRMIQKVKELENEEISEK